MRALVIGYGNTLRGDDAAGPVAAEALRVRIPGLAVVIQPELTPELAESISQAGLAIFIDAAVDLAPGEVCRREITPESGTAAFTHELTPRALLHMALALYRHAPRAYLYSIGGSHFDLGEGLSPAVAKAVPVVVDQVAAAIRPEGGSVTFR